jgi:hypothetical protein
MADRRGLQIIGWTFSGVALALALVAAMVVHDAIASGAAALEERPASVTLAAPAPVR